MRHSETGLSAIRTEAEGLQQLADSLGGEAAAAFDHAVDIILATRGRTIVSAIGKSGYIARKLAATLSSTGTPAIYIHPAEASHGDLGAITSQDVIILLSNSGESAELAPIVSYAKRFQVPVIAITSRLASALGRQADVVLQIPAAVEACPNGLAPTTSTLLQLALSDALAMALLKARNFQPADFRIYHPGGMLGAKIRTVESLMHRGAELPTVSASLRMRDAIVEMTGRAMGVLLVTAADGQLEGVITDGDLRRHMTDPGILDRTTGEIMTRHPRSIAGDRLLAEAALIFERHSITALAVTDGNGRLAGLLRLADLLKHGVL
ncbi:MAG: KpsF/GutQ family sugar-phosphate isomerase [Alphaproteobacteria bacterium]|nr:KpsF/GutQ family sugar-phosphate isomerase [Alphaproteobacteria bacterium]